MERTQFAVVDGECALSQRQTQDTEVLPVAAGEAGSGWKEEVMGIKHILKVLMRY